jgi:hypothetical protein
VLAKPYDCYSTPEKNTVYVVSGVSLDVEAHSFEKEGNSKELWNLAH